MTARPAPVDEDADELERPAIGWGRAIVSGLALVVVGAFACVYVPNYIVVHLTSLARDKRADLAAIVAVVAVALIAWLLRTLQRRRLI